MTNKYLWINVIAVVVCSLAVVLLVGEEGIFNMFLATSNLVVAILNGAIVIRCIE